MKKGLLLGSILMATCLSVLDVEASYTEALREKYADKNLYVEFLLTECRMPNVLFNRETGWTGSKDSSRVDNSVRKIRPSRPNSNKSISRDETTERIETLTDKTYNNLNSSFPRYIKRKYTHIQRGDTVCFMQDYPVYVNDDYPEMGVEFYVFESDSKTLEELRRKIEKAENPESNKMVSIAQTYQSIMNYIYGDGKPKRNAHDLNIIKDGKLYLLDRVNKKGRWINLSEIEYSKEAYKYFHGYFLGDFYEGGINEFNAIKNIVLSDDRTMKIKVLSASRKKVDDKVCDVERVSVNKMTTYGRTIRTYAYAGPLGNDVTEETVECDLYFHNGELAYFSLPFYNNGDKWNDINKYQQHPDALFKVEKISSVVNTDVFKFDSSYQLERIPLGW